MPIGAQSETQDAHGTHCRTIVRCAHPSGVHELDLRLAELAALQGGNASLVQLRRLGFTRSQIAHRRATGSWQIAGPGVVRLAGSPVDWQSRLIAAALAVGERAVISRASAARLHRLDGFEADEVIELTAPYGTFRSPNGLVVHRTRDLPTVDIATVRRPLPAAIRNDRRLRALGLLTDFRSTSASRTIIDLAAAVDAERLGRAIDSAARLGLSSPAYLSRRLADLRTPGRNGVRLLDEVMLDSGGHSWLERRFLRLMREAGLPRPACQVVHSRAGTFVARVDFDYRPRPLVVEVAGRRGHTSDADRARDARRRNELAALGVKVIEFITTQVVGDPGYVVTTVAERLAHLDSVHRSARQGVPIGAQKGTGRRVR